MYTQQIIMLLNWLAIIGGFGVLVWSADRFVLGSAAAARNLGVAPLVIGITIMGFGTSAPEMLVAGLASWEGNPGLAIGNVFGSNIANIGLVLGTSALITPMQVNSDILRREFPILFAIMLLALVLMLDGDLNFLDGSILLLGMVIMIMWMVHLGLRSRASDPLQSEFDLEVPKQMSMNLAIFWIVLGLTLLVLSSRLLVWGAVGVATSFGISDLVIGLTIVAIGTSLPELAASVMGALKGEHEIALGNILGSNMFNLLAVLGLPGVIQPSVFEPAVLWRDFPVMIGLTIALFLMAYGFRGPGRINRIEGGILLLAFAGYLASLYFTASR
jgi:cation:H+ antiporter